MTIRLEITNASKLLRHYNFFVIFGCLIGSGSISSGSAKSVSTLRSESRLEESLSSSSFPGSPKLRGKSPPINGINGTAYQQQQVSGSSRVASTSPFPISRSEESLQVWPLTRFAPLSCIPYILGTKDLANQIIDLRRILVS